MRLDDIRDKPRDTIFAVASGRLPAAIAVIRASGPQAADGLAALAGPLPHARRASLRDVRDPETGELLDRALVLWLSGPATFTGEDAFEIHAHGGRAVVGAIVRALGALVGFRPAEPGEFARRAFVAGRLDLTEAEGIADLVAADTDRQRRAALKQLGGSIRSQYESWAGDLVRARAMIEAELDFSDEEGVDGAWARDGRAMAETVLGAMERGLAGFDGARMVRDGVEIMLLGPVNAGKSTLLNAIAGRDVAIVSEEAGTTRDLIEVVVDLGGYRATLIDGAGLRDSVSTVEQEGVRRARKRAGEVDLVLWLSSDGSPPPAEILPPRVRSVVTKVDRPAGPELIRLRNEADFAVSSVSGDGIAGLLSGLADWVASHVSEAAPAVTRERHRVALADAITRVRSAVGRDETELAAEDLRLATDALGRVTGRIDTEAILDQVFGAFCIGK